MAGNKSQLETRTPQDLMASDFQAARQVEKANLH